MNSKVRTLLLAISFGAAIPAMAQLKPIAAQADTTPAFPAEVLILDQFGISPNRIERPAGPFVLYIQNRLRGHAETFTLGVDSDGATDLIAVSTNNGKRAAPLLLNLEPGTYRLKLGKRPSLVLKLVID